MEHGRGLEITPLSSGSGGNALVVTGVGTRLLIDAGLPDKELRRRLDQARIEPESIDWVIPTHRHKDHVQGLTDFVRSTRARVLAARPTMRVLGSVIRKRIVEAKATESYELAPRREEHGLCVHLQEVPHDAPMTLAIRVHGDGVRYGHLTDCGHVRDDLVEFLSGCDGLLIEFNHDREQLWAGTDPDFLKRRITSPTGHLSNEEAAGLLRRVASERLQHVWLAHLSRRNNTQEAALNDARQALGAVGLERPITILEQDRPMEAVCLLPTRDEEQAATV